jgi:hypothetical protein
MDLKYNPNQEDTNHLECIDRGFELPLSMSACMQALEVLRPMLPEDAIDMKRSNNWPLPPVSLIHLATIKKHRTDYDLSGAKISVDQVSGLGNFIEVEAVNAECTSMVRGICTQLDLQNIPVGYVELALRQQAFDLYKQGRYLLEEDK